MLPKGLSKIYAHIVTQIQDQPERLQVLACNCLKWVLNSRVPLTLYELRDAVALDDSCITSEDLVRHRERYDISDLIDICRNLIVLEAVQDTSRAKPASQGWAIVRPVHYSVQEYFVHHPASMTLNKELQVLANGRQIHFEMAKASMSYLDLVYLGFGPAKTFDVIRERLAGKRFPLSWYCARFFDQHVLEARTNSQGMYEHIDRLLSKDDRGLAALMQLRYLRRPNQIMDFRIFDWPVNALTVIASTKLADAPLLLNDEKWAQLTIHGYALHQACATAAFHQVELLLEAGLNPNLLDYEGQTPLSIAMQREDQGIVRLLLERGTVVDSRSLESAIHLGSLDFVKLLLKLTSEDCFDADSLAKALNTAFTWGSKDIAIYLLQVGAEPKDEMLVIAAERGWLESLELIVHGGVDVNTSYDGETALSTASRFGRIEVVRFLLQCDADFHGSKNNPGSALSAAARGCHAEIVHLLLDHGADPNHYDPQQGSALSQAALSGDRLITTALLDAGADIDAEDYRYGTPLIASLINDTSDYVIRNFEMRGEAENVTDILLKAGADVNKSGPKGTALLVACNGGNANVVELLINSNADPHLAFSEERTPLLAAVKSGNAQVVQILLANGADVNETNEQAENTPLHEACITANHSMTKILLDHGADPHAKAVVPMHLVERPNVIRAFGLTSRQALHAACAVKIDKWEQNRAHETVKDALLNIELLIRKGAEVNALDARGCSALELACSVEVAYAAQSFASKLLAAGADPNIPGGFYANALEAATTCGHQHVVDDLLAHGADVAKCGMGVLQTACLDGYGSIVKKLLDNGADRYLETRQANFPDARGFPAEMDTPLLRACFGGHSDIVKMLLDAGADAYATGLCGTTFETALAGYHQYGSNNSSKRGDAIKMLRAAQLPEPSPKCHYGSQCLGHLCMDRDKMEYFDYRHGNNPKWIIGTRFQCTKCYRLDLCEACKTALDEDPNAIDKYDFHKTSHPLSEFRHPENLGQEEPLAHIVAWGHFQAWEELDAQFILTPDF